MTSLICLVSSNVSMISKEPTVQGTHTYTQKTSLNAHEHHPLRHRNRSIRILHLQVPCVKTILVNFNPIPASSHFTRYHLPNKANILFCFFNQQYWLYAIENVFFNTYYLILVGYICYAYVLKQKNEASEYTIPILHKRLNLENNPLNMQKIIFYCVLGVLLAVYVAIFIVSIVY